MVDVFSGEVDLPNVERVGSRREWGEPAATSDHGVVSVSEETEVPEVPMGFVGKIGGGAGAGAAAAASSLDDVEAAPRLLFFRLGGIPQARGVRG